MNRRGFVARFLFPCVGTLGLALMCANVLASPAMSYFVTEGTECSWYKWDSEMPAERTLLAKLPKCPELVFFDSKQNTAYFTAENTVYTLPLKQQASLPSKYASLPKVDGRKEVLWIEKSNGKLRLLVISDVAEKNVVRKGDRVFLRKADGKLIEGITKGMFIAGNAYAPMWENPQLLTILELGSGGKWQRKAELASEAFFWLSRAREVWKEGAMNWDDVKVSPNWNEQGLSGYSASTDLCENETVDTNLHCSSGVEDFVNPLAQASVERYFNKTEITDLFHIEFKQTNTAILFNTVFGDTLHALLPLLFCKDKCIQQLPLDIRTSPGNMQVGLTVSYPYLLVVNDGDTNGNNPNVVDLRTGEIVFKASGFGAMWMTSP